MSAEARIVRVAKIKATLNQIGWKMKKDDLTGSIMCGWIADEFIYADLFDLEKCVQVESYIEDPVKLIDVIWQMACAKDPSLCREGRTPEQELTHREFKAERMDNSKIGLDLFLACHAREPFPPKLHGHAEKIAKKVQVEKSTRAIHEAFDSMQKFIDNE